MARNQIDTIDLTALIVLPLAAGIELGVWTLGLKVFNYDFSSALITLGTTGISTAFVATLASIGALVTTGTLSQGDYQDEEWYAIAGSLVIVPIYTFVPTFANFVDSSGIVALVIWLALSGVAVFISYKA